MGAMVLLPGYFATLTTEEQKKIIVIDKSDKVAPLLDSHLNTEKNRIKDKKRYPIEILTPDKPVAEMKKTLNKKISNKEIFGYLVIDTDLETKDDFAFYTENISNFIDKENIQAVLTDIVIELRLEKASLGIEKEELDKIIKRISLNIVQVGAHGEEKASGDLAQIAKIISTYVFIMFFYTMFAMWGLAIMHGILEEKTNRIIEILLSSVSPFELMMGKILGIGFVALTQYLIWLLCGLALYSFGSMYAGAEQFISVVSPTTLVAFGLFFILGYFLYSTLYAGVGAVCSTDHEAQQLQVPIVMLLIIPMILTFFLQQNPESTASRVLSFIPFFTPMVMFMRINTVTPPVYEVVISVILLIITI